MKGYEFVRNVEVMIEIVLSRYCALLYQLSDTSTRTFDGKAWVPMSECGDSGALFSMEHPVREDRLEDFFRTAFGTGEVFAGFYVHFSPVTSTVGVWAARDGWAMKKHNMAPRTSYCFSVLETDLPRAVYEAVLATSVMCS